jgi:hypothetical protein
MTSPPLLDSDHESRPINLIEIGADRQVMEKAFDLWSYDDVRARASDILERVKNGSMPCDGAWPPEQVQVFQRWVDSGAAP